MEQLTKQIGQNTFRVKKMNAIEALALKSVSSLDSTESATSLFNTILEKVEVKCGDVWYPVKKGDVYYPAGIEDDVDTIQQLISFFIKEYFQPLFQPSNKSN